MKNPGLTSIVFSAFLLGGVAVLMLTREPTIPMILLGIGVFGQLTAKLLRARQIKAQAEQAGTGQPATRPELKSEGSDKPQPEAEGRSR